MKSILILPLSRVSFVRNAYRMGDRREGERIILRARLKSFLSEKLCINGSQINNSIRFKEDFEMDYADKMELFVSTEIKFKTKDIPLDLRTIGDLFNFLDSSLSGTK